MQLVSKAILLFVEQEKKKGEEGEHESGQDIDADQEEKVEDGG